MNRRELFRRIAALGVSLGLVAKSTAAPPKPFIPAPMTPESEREFLRLWALLNTSVMTANEVRLLESHVWIDMHSARV